MNFIDTHTHLYDEAYGDAAGQDEAVKRALEAGVEKLVFPDEYSATRDGMLEMCKRWPGVAFPCLGVHPTELSGDWRKEIELLDKAVEQLIKVTPADASDVGAAIKIVAIGECGMDFHWVKDNAEVQEEVFRHQLDLSLRHSLPIIIHAREATDKIFSVLDSYKGRGLKGVFHAFSGSLETFRRLDAYGNWYVGIGGVVTFKKAGIADIIPYIPADRILLETDAPYLTPVPHRGERNESAYIPDIAAFIASKKGMDLERLAEITCNNSTNCFDFTK